MTVFQWGTAKPLIKDDGTFTTRENGVQVIICLDCFDWCHSTPFDCRMWMLEHVEKEHPNKIYMKQDIDVGSYDNKRYD
jgi:hypothetical protein